jgi:hypothetical protein
LAYKPVLKMKTQDLALQKSFLQKVILDDPNYRNYYALRKLFADYLTKLNVTFYDPCCPAASNPIPDDLSVAPLRFNNSTGDIESFDVNTQTWTTVDIASLIDPIEEMDVFLIGGQSNAVGNSGASGGANSPDPQAETVYQYYLNTFGQVTNEVGQANTGSAWPSFGIAWNNETGRKICFVPSAADGTGQVALSDTGFGNWSPTGTLWQTSVDRTNAALLAIEAAGFKPVFRGVLWHQGENDGNKINDATITQSDYQTGLTNMIADYRTEFGSEMPFYIYRTGTRVSASDTGFAAVRAAQEAVAAANPLVTKVVFFNALEFPNRSLMVDQYHYTQAGYNEMGRISAENILAMNDLYWQRQGENKLFYNKGNVGIGIENPVHPLDVYTTTSTRVARLRQTADISANVYIENNSATSNAAAGFRMFNNSGLNAQILLGSSVYSTAAHILLIHALTGEMLVGSNSSSFSIFTGGAPSLGQVKVRVASTGNMAIGSNPTPNTSAILDLQSTTKAFLPPRMTTTEKNAIASPVAGMVVYDTTLNKLCVYTTGWETITSA